MKPFLYIFFLCLLTLAHVSTAQDGNKLIENEINEQVWKPFKQGYESRNATLFNSVHSDDMLRINQGGITLGPEYKDNITRRYQTASDVKITIDFSHERRFYNGDVGYEVGYYRVISKKPGKIPRKSYGRFHVVLKKTDGRWKIIQDWDTDTVGTMKITEEHFMGATFLRLDE